MEEIIKRIKDNMTVESVMELRGNILDLWFATQSIDDEEQFKEIDCACNTILKIIKEYVQSNNTR